MRVPPQPDAVDGRLVTLERLRRIHARELLASASDPEVWRWKLTERPRTVEEVDALVVGTLIGPDRWPFVVRRHDGRVIGSTTLGNFDMTHGCVEMGFTWLEREAWGQGYNEDIKRVLLRECFETLGLQRVEWQVDANNERSIAALTRLGFVYEGCHRGRHRRPDGSRRDSMFFSILLDEWPATDLRLAQLIGARSREATDDNG